MTCGKAVAQYGLEGRDTKKSEFSLFDSYGFVWECVMQCLGEFYGLVTWHGEIALMSHEARKTAIQSWVVPKLRKKMQKTLVESIEEIHDVVPGTNQERSK